MEPNLQDMQKTQSMQSIHSKQGIQHLQNLNRTNKIENQTGKSFSLKGKNMDFKTLFALEQTDLNILLNIGFGFIAGILILLGYLLGQKNKNVSKSFCITILLLPVVVVVVIPLIATDLKKALSLAGIFALVRFRSVPGKAKDIFYIFFTLTVGVAIALDYYIVAATLLLIVTISYIIMERFIPLPEQKLLKITIPEDMNYDGIFDDIFAKYLTKYELADVKTTNMGALFIISYKIHLKNPADSKNLIDEIRTKNGNLSVSIQFAYEDITAL